LQDARHDAEVSFRAAVRQRVVGYTFTATLCEVVDMS